MFLRRLFSKKRDVQESQELRAPIQYLRLEQRRVLAADFTFTAGTILTLDGFTAGESVTISEAGGDYVFTLDSGEFWTGVDVAGILTGTGTDTLLADKATMDALTTGILLDDSLGNDNAANFDTVDFSALTGILDFDGFGAITQTGASTVAISTVDFGATTVTLTEATNDFDTVSFDATTVTLVDTDALTIDTSTATTVDISAGGLLDDAAGATTSITGAATLSGTSIDLGTNGTISFGTLNFNSAGDVSIIESDSTEITGTNTADNLTLTSGGAITDATGTSITTTGDATFTAATSITLNDDGTDVLTVTDAATFDATAGTIDVGSAGTANFGTLNFNSTDDVTIQEDSDTIVFGTNTAKNLDLDSTGSITDAAGTSITTTADGKFTAGTSITLNDTAGDTLDIASAATLSAPTSIDIGAAGTANFGTLNFNSSGDVTIQEDSATTITGTNTAANLSITSTKSIDDATGTSITATADARFVAGTTITLNDDATDTLSVTDAAEFSGTDGVDVGPAGTANFGTLNFNSTGDVNIQEDSATVVVGSNTAKNLSLTSADSITDAKSTDITASADATFTAATTITLNDNAGDVLSVTGDAAFTGPTSVDVGSAGTANFGSLNFNSTGDVTIQEDSATNLFGTNTAKNLDLTSAGAVTDRAATSVTTTVASTITSDGAITLADETTDTFAVTGLASFISQGGEIRVGVEAAVDPFDCADAGGVIDSTATVNFGTLFFNSANAADTLRGDVLINEDSTTTIVATSKADSLYLGTDGTIDDTHLAAVDLSDPTGGTVNLYLDAAGAIDVGAAAGADIIIDGSAFFRSGSTIDVGVTAGANSAAIINLGTLTFNSPAAVTIFEDDATVIQCSNTADSLLLDSGGSITDLADTDIAVTKDATVTATTSITLNDDAADTLTVGGDAVFSGPTSIDIGAAGTANFGTLNFNSTGDVTIQEDSATIIDGTNTAKNLSLTSTDSITDSAGASITTTVDATFIAGTSITLNDNATDVLSVTGDAAFTGPTSIDIGAAGTANFATVNFNSGGDVTIQEDSATVIDGTNTAANLSLTSAGSITDSAGASITTTADATFTAATSITLNDTAADVLTVASDAVFSGPTSIDIGAAGTANFGTLNFNSAGDVTVQEDSATVLDGTNTADNLSLTSAGSITDNAGTSVAAATNATITAATSITLNDNGTDVLDVTGDAVFSGPTSIDIGAAGTANFGTLNFNSAGDVTIQEDSATVIDGTNTADNLDLTSAGSITDNAAASITTTADASFTAGTSITLNDTAADVLSVAGDAAFAGPTSVNVGAAGTANFGTLNFNSAGDVTIQEDSATVLDGTSTADNLDLTSAGSITDNAGTSVTTTGNATVTAATSITLNDSGTDVLDVTGDAVFTGPTSIAIGAAGTANFGTLNFNSGGAVTIQEDSATAIDGTNTASVLSLTSSDAITDNAGASITTTSDASFIAGTSITLNDNGTDVLDVGGAAAFTGPTSIDVGAAGTANFATLTFNSGGAVAIQEDSSTAIDGSNTAGSLALTSAADITDVAGSDITIADTASFTAGAGSDITIGDGTSTLAFVHDPSDATEFLTLSGKNAFIEADSNFNMGGTTISDLLYMRTVGGTGHIVQVAGTVDATTLGVDSIGAALFNSASVATVAIEADAATALPASYDLNDAAVLESGLARRTNADGTITVPDETALYTIVIQNDQALDVSTVTNPLDGADTLVGFQSATGNIYFETTGANNLTLSENVIAGTDADFITGVAGGDMIVTPGTQLLRGVTGVVNFVLPLLTVQDPGGISDTFLFVGQDGVQSVGITFGTVVPTAENFFTAEIVWANGTAEFYDLGLANVNPLAFTTLTIQTPYTLAFLTFNPVLNATITVFNDANINLFENADSSIVDLSRTTDTFTGLQSDVFAFSIEPPPFEAPTAPTTEVLPTPVDRGEIVDISEEFDEVDPSLPQPNQFYSLRFLDADAEMEEERYEHEATTLDEIRQEIIDEGRYPPGLYRIYQEGNDTPVDEIEKLQSPNDAISEDTETPVFPIVIPASSSTETEADAGESSESNESEPETQDKIDTEYESNQSNSRIDPAIILPYKSRDEDVPVGSSVASVSGGLMVAGAVVMSKAAKRRKQRQETAESGEVSDSGEATVLSSDLSRQARRKRKLLSAFRRKAN